MRISPMILPFPSFLWTSDASLTVSGGRGRGAAAADYAAEQNDCVA